MAFYTYIYQDATHGDRRHLNDVYTRIRRIGRDTKKEEEKKSEFHTQAQNGLFQMTELNRKKNNNKYNKELNKQLFKQIEEEKKEFIMMASTRKKKTKSNKSRQRNRCLQSL